MNLERSETQKREKTLLSSLLLSAPGPLVTGIPAMTSLSATQLADFIRRTAELVALAISWWVYRRIHQDSQIETRKALKLEKFSHYVVALAMLCSGLAMMIIGCLRISEPRVSGNVMLGLVIAGLGLVTNGYFWQRYRYLNQKDHHIVMASQQRLYRAKTMVDGAVATSLLGVTFFPRHPLTPYVDALGCIVVGLYLLFNAYKQFQTKLETEANP